MEYIDKAASAYGLDVEGKDKAEVLAMRSNPKIATAVFTIFSLENKREMERQLKRPINESELYMGHFLGATAPRISSKRGLSIPTCRWPTW